MIKVTFHHKTYSENKVKIKNIIKKYGMSWDGSKNAWINPATGDGVYIDRSVMEMILSDSFSSDMPMTLFVDAKNPDFLKEFKEKVESLGGGFDVESGPSEQSVPAPLPQPVKKQKSSSKSNIYTKKNIRDDTGCNAEELCTKGYADLQDISGRWERRKQQILLEFSRMGFDRETIDDFLHREEINFRKKNACWVTGEFPGAGTSDTEVE